MRLAALTLVTLSTATLASQPSVPFIVEETGTIYQSFQAAVDAIGEGRGTIIVNGGTYSQCAVQRAGEITYRATKAGAAIFDGVACEGKGGKSHRRSLSYRARPLAQHRHRLHACACRCREWWRVRSALRDAPA